MCTGRNNLQASHDKIFVLICCSIVILYDSQYTFEKIMCVYLKGMTKQKYFAERWLLFSLNKNTHYEIKQIVDIDN